MSDSGPCNVALAVEAFARERPDTPALYTPKRRDHRGRVHYSQLSFAEFQQAIRRIAGGLQHYGLERGMRAALMVRPGPEFFPLFFALLRAGIVPVVVDPGIGRRNLRRCLAEAQPHAFIGEPIAHAARALLGWTPSSVRMHISVGGRFPLSAVTLDAIERAGDLARDFAFPDTRPDETAAILFTSGSTGISKGVIYEHGHFAAQLGMLRAVYGIEPGEIDVPTFAPFALFDAALGVTTVLPQMDFSRPGNADPRRIVAAIEEFGASNLFGSPAVIANLGRYGAERGVRLPTLRRAISAGAPSAAEDVERFSRMLVGDAELHTPYGATEALPVASIGSRELLETRAETESGGGVCIGAPIKGVRAWVIDVRDDPIETWQDVRVLPPGETGEIAVQGDAVTGRYLLRPEANALAKLKHPDGGMVHRMGDLGRFDEQGRLWFCGRKSQRVKTAAETLFTISCERVFAAHPSVRRAALVGVARGQAEIPVVWIELEPQDRGTDRERLLRELRALGAAHSCTRNIDHFLFRRHFPVDVRHQSKIRREELAQRANRKLP